MVAETVFRLDRVPTAVLDRWYHKAKPGAVAHLISSDGPPIRLVRLKDGGDVGSIQTPRGNGALGRCEVAPVVSHDAALTGRLVCPSMGTRCPCMPQESEPVFC